MVQGSTGSWVQAEEEDEPDHDHRDQTPSCSYLKFSSIGYDMDFGGIEVEPDGYRMKLSLALGDSLFGVIDRSNSDGEFTGSKYDFDTEGYGFGLRASGRQLVCELYL